MENVIYHIYPLGVYVKAAERPEGNRRDLETGTWLSGTQENDCAL